MMDDSVAAAAAGGRELETAVKRLERGKKKLLRVMAKPFRRWLIVIYKQALALVHQAFEMVTNLEKMAGGVVGGEDNVIRALIEKNRIWLVDEIGKKFHLEKHNNSLKNLVISGGGGVRVRGGRGGRGKKARTSSSSSVVITAADASSPPPSYSLEP